MSSRSLILVVSLFGLLVSELLLLTLRFDAGALASQHGWLSRLLASASILPQLAAVMATATLVFGGVALLSDKLKLGGTGVSPVPIEANDVAPRTDVPISSWIAAAPLVDLAPAATSPLTKPASVPTLPGHKDTWPAV